MIDLREYSRFDGGSLGVTIPITLPGAKVAPWTLIGL